MPIARLAASSLAAALAIAPAAAQLVVREVLIPRASAFPHDPAVGADGAAWYTDQANSYIGRLDPVTEQIVDYATPTPNSGPHGITVTPDGFVWYTGQDTGRIGRVNPATGAITEFVMPANANRPHTPIAHAGAVWFTAQTNATYGRLDPTTGQTQVWSAPAGSRPYGIADAPDGSLWIAFFGTNALGRVNVANGALTVITLPNAGARPRRIAVAADGRVYYTDHARGFLGRYDPATAQFREWRAPANQPYGIWTGSDGRIWFHASASALMVAFDPRSEQMATVTIPTAGCIVRHMTWDPVRGRLWLALSGTRRIGRIELGPPVGTLGTACAGTAGVPGITIAGLPRIGANFTIGVTNTVAPAAALFAGGSTTTWNGLTLPFDLAAISAPGCFVTSSWDVLVASGAPGPVSLAVPVDIGLQGVVVYWQWALAGEPGRTLVTTQALRTALIGT
jgi:virginiamycin B lyase